MYIFGITGSINHGKSTLASALLNLEPGKSRHFESSRLVASVAQALHASTRDIPDKSDIAAVNRWLEPLPAILSETVHAHCSISQISFTKEDVEKAPADYAKLFIHLDNLKKDPSLLHQKITEDNKEQFRPILQWLGGYLVAKVNSGIWYEEIVRQLKTAEADGIELCTVDGVRYPTDAELVRSVGGLIVEIRRPSVAPTETLDPTERERSNIEPDILIINDGDLDNLRSCVTQVMNDVKNKEPKETYTTSLAPS